MKQLLYEEENGVKVYFAVVPSSKIKFNPHNPNVMGESEFLRLKENIEKYGYLEPAVVGAVEEDGEEVYYVIDGEHRVRVMLERGYEQIPVILVEGLDKVAIFSGAYTFNKIRGRIDPERLNRLVRFLGEENTADVVAEWLGESRGFVERVLSDAERTNSVLVESVSSERISRVATSDRAARRGDERSSGGSSAGRRRDAGRFEEAVPTSRVMLMIPLEREEYEFVTRVLRAISNNASQALLEIVRYYAQQNGLEGE